MLNLFRLLDEKIHTCGEDVRFPFLSEEEKIRIFKNIVVKRVIIVLNVQNIGSEAYENTNMKKDC